MRRELDTHMRGADVLAQPLEVLIPRQGEQLVEPRVEAALQADDACIVVEDLHRVRIHEEPRVEPVYETRDVGDERLAHLTDTRFLRRA